MKSKYCSIVGMETGLHRVYVLVIVLSREMDPLKVVSFENNLLKGRARRFSAYFARPPSCESPLKIPRNLARLLAIRILSDNSTHSSVSALLSTTYSCWRRRCEQIENLFPMAQWNVKPMLFSVGKGAMNPPRYWLRRDVMPVHCTNCAVDQCWISSPRWQLGS
jgi:hypothetical protein